MRASPLPAVVAGSSAQPGQTCSQRLLQEEEEGAAARCRWSLPPPPPPPCVSVPAPGAQQLEKHNGQQPRNWKILSCFSLPCFSLPCFSVVSPGVCLGPFLSGCLRCTLTSYTGCPVTIQSQRSSTHDSESRRGLISHGCVAI